MSTKGGIMLHSNQLVSHSKISLPLDSIATPTNHLNQTSQGDRSVTSTHRLFQNIKLSKGSQQIRPSMLPVRRLAKNSEEFDSMSVQENHKFKWGDRDYPSESSPINEKPTSLFRNEVFAPPSQALFDWPQDSSSPVNNQDKGLLEVRKIEESSFNPVRPVPPVQLDINAGRVGDLQSLRNHANNKSNVSTDRNDKSTGRARIKTRQNTLDPILQESLLTRVARDAKEFDGPTWVKPKPRKQALSNTFLENFRTTKTTFLGTHSQNFQVTHSSSANRDERMNFLTHTDFNQTTNERGFFRATSKPAEGETDRSKKDKLNKTATAGFRKFDYSLNKSVIHPQHAQYRSFHPDTSKEPVQPATKKRTTFASNNFSFYLQDRTNVVQKDGEFSFDLKKKVFGSRMRKAPSTVGEEDHMFSRDSVANVATFSRRKVNQENMFLGLKPSILLKLKNIARKIKRETPLLFMPNWLKALCDPTLTHTRKGSPTTGKGTAKNKDGRGTKRTLSMNSNTDNMSITNGNRHRKDGYSQTRSPTHQNDDLKLDLDKVDEGQEHMTELPFMNRAEQPQETGSFRAGM